jgi:hypothetical protein
MKKSLSILSIAAIALFLGSCSSSKPPQATQTPPPPSNPAPNPSETQKEQPKTSQNRASVSGLIPSTNPEQRRQKIAQGRKDPFAFVPVQPQIKIQPLPPQTPSGSNPSGPPSPSGSTPSGLPSSTTEPPLPPQPELAKAVTVTGLIDIGGLPQIIVKAPGEKASRYVQVGDYLSNGQVLVKRIENYQSPKPVVVLEELGQEVYKEVGDGLAQGPSQSQPRPEKTALLPDSQEGGF